MLFQVMVLEGEAEEVLRGTGVSGQPRVLPHRGPDISEEKRMKVYFFFLMYSNKKQHWE